jgi:hypothetical protein
MPTAKRVLEFRASLAQPVVRIEEGSTRGRVAFPSGQNGAAPVGFARASATRYHDKGSLTRFGLRRDVQPMRIPCHEGRFSSRIYCRAGQLEPEP